jgi:hypothetical protein
MFRKMTVLAIPLTLLLVLLAGVPCWAQCPGSAISYKYQQPITQMVYNFCAARSSLGFDSYPLSETDPLPSNPDPNALVTLSGGYFFEQSFEPKPNGDCHVHWTSHYNLTGQTAQGINYVGKDQQNYDLKLDPDSTGAPTSDFMTSDKFKLIAQGPTPDVTMIQKLHVRVSVDKNGNVNTNIQKNGNPVFKCK